jgi:hypothetical protein
MLIFAGGELKLQESSDPFILNIIQSEKAEWQVLLGVEVVSSKALLLFFYIKKAYALTFKALAT